jgi:hypothetical protein
VLSIASAQIPHGFQFSGEDGFRQGARSAMDVVRALYKNPDLIWVEPAQMKDAHRLVLQLVGARILSSEVKFS